MNKFQFMGRLTRDPESRFTQNTNTPVTTFSIAVNRRFAEANGERKADFFNLTAFGKLAEFCSKYYRKGQQVLVEGRIQNRTWEDQSGQKRYATDYIIENAYFADSIELKMAVPTMFIPAKRNPMKYNLKPFSA